MKKPQSRCVECDERREGCHSVCEDYISFKKEVEEYNRMVNENRRKSGDFSWNENIENRVRDQWRRYWRRGKK